MSKDAFLDDNYEVPTSGGGFTKLETGENKFRVLSSPVLMWIEWIAGKPIRHKFDKDNKPAKGPDQKDSVKHGWGLIVWNYKTESIEVLELDKQNIIAGLAKHAKDPDWGHPKGYDVVIEKKGSGMDTEYFLVCKPHKEVSQEIIDAYLATPIDLSKLLVEGGNPFLSPSDSAPEQTAKKEEPKKEEPKVSDLPEWKEGDDVPKGFKVVDGKLKKDLPF